MPARTSFQLANDTTPKSGPVGVNIALDFTGGDNVSGDLVSEQQQGVIEYVQSIYIDNSNNAKALSITFSGTQQTITVKANTQSLLPVIAAAGPLRWQAASVGAAVIVPCILMSQRQQPYQWATV